MTELQRGHHDHDQLIRHDQLDFPFLDLLDLASLANERLTAVQRAELALAQDLPRTVVLGTYSTATGSEHSTLDPIDVAGRNEKGELEPEA